MTTTLTLTSVILGIFIIHTIFTHLLNWAVRSDDADLSGISVFAIIIEMIIIIVLLINITN